MMELMEAIYARRSVRGYKSDPVSRETLQKLMNAAVQAPTAMNQQPWAFGVIEGVDRLRDFSDRTKAYMLAHLDAFPALAGYREMFENPESNLCYGAPACIVIYTKPGGVAAMNDCSMAAQNLMLAACDMGLGTCWIGFLGFLLNQPDVKGQLGVPDDYQMIAPIIVGYPAGPVPPVEKAPPQVIFWQK